MQDQQHLILALQAKVEGFPEFLERVLRAEEDCKEANVDENDYTVFTGQDLKFEFELVVQNISKKISFIDNQVFRIPPADSE